jgi:uncharacterized protein
MAIEAARRVFAAEYQRSSAPSPSAGDLCGGVLTPTGLCCRQVFVAGALTEVQDDGKGVFLGRLSDGTGTYELAYFGPHPALTSAVEHLSPPVFVTVTGQAMLPAKEGKLPFIRPEEITPVSRAVRDLWVICTAEETTARLEAVQAAIDGRAEPGAPSSPTTPASSLDRAGVLALAAVVGRALDQVQPLDPAALVDEDPTVVLTRILEAGDRKGMTVTDLICAGEQAGLSSMVIERAIGVLLAEGDCYTPVKGTIRLV